MEVKQIIKKFENDIDEFRIKGNTTPFSEGYLIGERIDLLLSDLRIASKEYPEIQKVIEEYENNHYDAPLKKAFKLLYDVEKAIKQVHC